MGASPQTPRLRRAPRDYAVRRAEPLDTQVVSVELHKAMVILEVVALDVCEIPPQVSVSPLESGSPRESESVAASRRGIHPCSGIPFHIPGLPRKLHAVLMLHAGRV